MHHAARARGASVGFDYSSDPLSEVCTFFRRSQRVIVPLTGREILDGQIAPKRA